MPFAKVLSNKKWPLTYICHRKKSTSEDRPVVLIPRYLEAWENLRRNAILLHRLPFLLPSFLPEGARVWDIFIFGNFEVGGIKRWGWIEWIGSGDILNGITSWCLGLLLPTTFIASKASWKLLSVATRGIGIDRTSIPRCTRVARKKSDLFVSIWLIFFSFSFCKNSGMLTYRLYILSIYMFVKHYW